MLLLCYADMNCNPNLTKQLLSRHLNAIIEIFDFLLGNSLCINVRLHYSRTVIVNRSSENIFALVFSLLRRGRQRWQIEEEEENSISGPIGVWRPRRKEERKLAICSVDFSKNTRLWSPNPLYKFLAQIRPLIRQ